MAETKGIFQPELRDVVLPKGRRLFRIIGIGMGLVVVCPILIHLGRFWIPRVWGDLRFVNYLVALIPTILSILFAFVIDKDLERRMKTMWRLGIVACGILYSVVLWHQQELTDTTNLRMQTTIVNEAVNKANEHSDQQIGYVRSDVQGVQKGLGITASKDDLSKTATALTKIVSKSQADLTDSINKMKPIPPEAAKLQLSIFPAKGNTAPLPILTGSVEKAKDDTYSVDLLFTNASATAAENLDTWFEICQACSFGSEPAEMDRPAGSDEHVRHRLVPLLNPGAQLATKLSLKSTLPPPFQFDVGFRYACKACGVEGTKATQKVTLLALPTP